MSRAARDAGKRSPGGRAPATGPRPRTVPACLLAVSAAWLAAAAPGAEDGRTPAQGAREEPLPTAEEILANPLGDDAYVATTRCLTHGRYDRIEVVGEGILVFEGRGDRLWINVLPRRCPGLRADMALAIERRGMRLCSRDRFRGIARSGAEMPTTYCSFGEFQQVSPEHLDALLDALAAHGRTRTPRETARSAAGAAGAGGERQPVRP